MTLVVVDASVVLKWFLPERWSEEARQLLDEPVGLVAPDLLFAEVGNAMWKRVRMRQLSGPVARRMVADIATIAVRPVAGRLLLKDAMNVAVSAGITVYDAMYLVLAVRLQTHLVTADQRLSAALSGLPRLREHIRLIATKA
jgi:predicted nucleic acid-binding protein